MSEQTETIEQATGQDTAGATDEHRALNCLTMRYQAIYARADEAFAEDFSLTRVEVRRVSIPGDRKVAVL